MKRFIPTLIFILSFLVSYGQDDKVYSEVDQMPIYPGCDTSDQAEKTKCTNQNIIQFIGENLKYPQEAKDGKVEGMVLTKFVITKEGEVDNIQIVKDIGSNCGQAARDVLNLLSDMKGWTPGIKEGKQVAVQYTLPINFRL
ncbi:MAG: energy transducer TonB [Saprospiraceae bacterium]|nr:energy transducer TonB [Saprospiraceae bacterium]